MAHFFKKNNGTGPLNKLKDPKNKFWKNFKIFLETFHSKTEDVELERIEKLFI